MINSRTYSPMLSLLRWVCGLMLLIALTACATVPQLVDHAFGFDAMNDSPDALILDYRYGQIKPQSYEYREGLGVRQAMNYNGGLQRGDTLYVKWRIKSTGEEYQDTVDLKTSLPTDITHHRIHFVVKGPQLYVYLILPEKRPTNWPPSPLRLYSHLKVITIYPDQSKF